MHPERCTFDGGVVKPSQSVRGTLYASDCERRRQDMEMQVTGKKISVLGAGKMGSILLQTLLNSGLLAPQLTRATVAHPDKARALSTKLNIPVCTDNAQAVKDADVVLICVKPQVVQEVIEEIRQDITTDQLLISVAASVPTSLIEKNLGKDVPVIRAMPNTPSLLRCGMAALAKGKHASASQLEMAAAMFNAVGRTVVLDEKHMDAVTALSASGPAYF